MPFLSPPKPGPSLTSGSDAAQRGPPQWVLDIESRKSFSNPANASYRDRGAGIIGSTGANVLVASADDFEALMIAKAIEASLMDAMASSAVVPSV